MINQQHPITPPPELVEQWYDAIDNQSTSWKQQLATRAAQWGADQELEACCGELPYFATELRAARRPKPPSLKEQALEALERMDQFPTTEDKVTILRALEQLND